MNISEGLSIINRVSYGDNIQSAKTYLWPSYNAGSVEKIRPVIKETDGNIPYKKSSDEDTEKILSAIKNQNNFSYSPYGKLENKNPLIKPGILFDAIV